MVVNNSHWMNEELFYNYLEKNDKQIFTKLKKIYEELLEKQIIISPISFINYLTKVKIVDDEYDNFIWKVEWISEDTIVKIINLLDDFQESNINSINNDLDKKVLNEDLFNEIYQKFDVENINNNEKIIEETLNWYYFEDNLSRQVSKYDRFFDFMNFLEDKINNSSTYFEVDKIPKIISNMNWYNWWSEKYRFIRNKKNKVMSLFNQKKKEFNKK